MSSDESDEGSYHEEDESADIFLSSQSIRNNRRPVRQNIPVSVGQRSMIADDQKTFSFSDIYGMIDREDIEMLERFLENSLSLVRNQGDDNWLMKACYGGAEDCVQYLLDVGVDINYRSADGTTALINCAYAPWSEKIHRIVQKLILAGADPAIKNNNGYTILDIAFYKKKVELVHELIELGADLSQVNINGMGPLEYILKSGGMDSLLDLVISRIGGDGLPIEKLINLGKINEKNDNIFHLLAGKDTPYLSQILIQEEKRIEAERANWLAERDRKLEAKAALASNKINLSEDIAIGNFDSTWIFDLNEEQQNYQFNLENDADELEKIMNHSLKQALTCSNRNGKSPLAIAIETQQIKNIELMVEYGRIDLNLPGILGSDYYWSNIKLPIELAVSMKNLNMIKALIRLGAGFSTSIRKNWIEWYLYTMKGTSEETLDIIFNHIEQPIVDIHPKRDRNGCNCTILMKVIRLRHFGIIQQMLLDRKSSQVDLNFKCRSDECFGYNGPFRMLINMILRSFNGRFSINEFKILHLFLKQGLGGDLNQLHSIYRMSDIPNELMAVLLLNFGFRFDNHRIHFYRQKIHKFLICHAGFDQHIRNQRDPDTGKFIEYVTDEPIEEIDRENFIVLENGIVWSVETLFNYLTMTVQGVNQFDSRSPWKGERILTGNDLRNLEYHSNPLGMRIYKFFNVNTYLKLFDEKFINQLKECGSVFLAKGEYFDLKILDILNDREMEEWSQVRNFESNNAMPRISKSIATKIETLKKDYLGMFYESYQSLNDEQKGGLQGVNEHLHPEAFQKLFIGEECIMTIGFFMIRAHRRLTSWKPE